MTPTTLTIILSLLMGLCSYTAITVYHLRKRQTILLNRLDEVYNGLSVIFCDNRHAHRTNNLCLKYSLATLREIMQEYMNEATEEENYELAGKCHEVIKQMNQLIENNLYNEQQ